MIIRSLATFVWIAITIVGIHMMRDHSPYLRWMSEVAGESGSSTIEQTAKNAVEAMGPTATGRVLTILGSCMIAGTWYPLARRKKEAVGVDERRIRSIDERILLGETAEEPQYEYKI